MPIAVSVCVAVYNVENYLQECLQSLQNQTLENTEFIIIDDGSTDSSLEIINSFVAQDKRFKLFKNNTNIGLLLTRKRAIEIAQGEYIIFLDGDDYLSSENSLSIAYEKILNSNVDILRFKCCCVGKNPQTAKSTENSVNNNIDNKTISATEALIEIFKNRKFNFCIWNKIYKTSCLKKSIILIPNENFTCAEDAFYTFNFLLNSKTFLSADTSPLYTYRVGVGVSGSNINKRKIEQYSEEIKCTDWLREIINKDYNNTQIDLILECISSLRKSLIKNQIYRMTGLQSDELCYFIRLMLTRINSTEFLDLISTTLNNNQINRLLLSIVPEKITPINSTPSKIIYIDTRNNNYLTDITLALKQHKNSIDFSNIPELFVIRTTTITHELLLNVFRILTSRNYILCIDESSNEQASLLLNSISHITLSNNKQLIKTLKTVNNNIFLVSEFPTVESALTAAPNSMRYQNDSKISLYEILSRINNLSTKIDHLKQSLENSTKTKELLERRNTKLQTTINNIKNNIKNLTKIEILPILLYSKFAPSKQQRTKLREKIFEKLKNK